MPERPLIVVVTGPAAAGKTTFAAALADALELPLVAKDALKEVLAEPLQITGREASHRLGRAVLAAMKLLVEELAGAHVSLVVEGNFRDTAVFDDVDDAQLVQVHVSAPPDVIRERLRARTGRHAVHYDSEAADELAARTGSGEWEPLVLTGPVVRVDTRAPVEVAAVVAEVRSLLQTER
jgi:predicted kinase